VLEGLHADVGHVGPGDGRLGADGVALLEDHRLLAARLVEQAAGTHHGVGHAARAQGVLALQLPLEDVAEHLVERVVVLGDRARGHQHELPDAGSPGGLGQVLHALVVDHLGPVRALGRLGADRGDHGLHAGHGGPEARGVLHVAAHHRDRRRERHAGLRGVAHQGADGVALRGQLLDDEPAGLPAGADDEHAVRDGGGGAGGAGGEGQGEDGQQAGAAGGRHRDDSGQDGIARGYRTPPGLATAVSVGRGTPPRRPAARPA
jgi:hypothetical protein